MTRRQMLMLMAAVPFSGYLVCSGISLHRGQAFHAHAKFEAPFVPPVSTTSQLRRRPGREVIRHG